MRDSYNIRDIFILAILYFIAARVGQLVAIPPGNVTPFWPAAGIILCAVLIKGYKIWPGIWLGAILGNSWAYADFSTLNSSFNFLVAANLNGAGDTLCALFGYFMITRNAAPTSFLFKERNIMDFIIYAVIVGSIISATFGVLGLCLGGVLPWDNFWYTWITWAVGDGVGIIVVTPLIVITSLLSSKHFILKHSSLEKTVFLLIVLSIFLVGFRITEAVSYSGYLVAYLIFPLLIFVSFRYGYRMAYCLVAMVSIIAIAETSFNNSVFTGVSVNQSLIHLQIYIAISTLTALFLNAVIVQKQDAMNNLRTLNTRLQESNDELDSFSYSISHDLRAPLRSIDGFSHVLKEDYDGILDVEAKDYLGRIINSANKMGMLIDDLLKLSRASRSKLSKTRINISRKITEILERHIEEQKDREIEFTIEPDIFAYADESLINLVLENLIGNAVKYTSKNKVTKIEAGCNESNNQVTVYIKDNGVGYDKNFENKLFEVFQRLHNNDQFGGTGVGLAIVQRIIRRHNGKVWGQSELNEGATFYFSLPNVEE